MRDLLPHEVPAHLRDYFEEVVPGGGGQIAHPTLKTVKPLALMRWLVRLACPPGGTILDLFAGTGTTGEASALEGARCILIERDPGYARLAVQRLSRAAAGQDPGDE